MDVEQTDVPQLSLGKVLKRVWDLQEETPMFFDIKDKDLMFP
jgi:hypothetical protein